MNTREKRIRPLKIPTSEYPDFSQRLTIAMEIRNYQVAQLAQDIYLTKSAICGYRTGYRTPDLITLKRLAIALDVSTDFLVGLTEYIYV